MLLKTTFFSACLEVRNFLIHTEQIFGEHVTRACVHPLSVDSGNVRRNWDISPRLAPGSVISPVTNLIVPARGRYWMMSDPKTWLARVARNPLALLAGLGSIFVLLANWEQALDGASNLWQRSTGLQSRLESTWQGDWTSREGFLYGFAMQLDVEENDEATGEISWQLKTAPPESHLAGRVGDTGIEYVKGRFDRAKMLATISGYKVSDETLLALDNYKFQIKPDKITFVGMTKYRGAWEAQVGGAVIISDKP